MTDLPNNKSSAPMSLSQTLKRFAGDRAGATAIEYGLIAALIGVAGIAVAPSVSKRFTEKVAEIDAALDDPAGTATDEKPIPRSRYLEQIE